tara:strand:- start:345 stop:932 length:588 start_codon:yes stop_codon:yes gene_type:complete
MHNYLKKINPNILVFLLFLSFFFIQRLFFDVIQDTTIAFAGSLIYLPHGIRVLATLIGGRKIIPGLLLGHIVSGLYTHSFATSTNIEFAEILNLETSIINLLTSIGSSFCVLLALFILNINYDNIKSISLKTIFLVSIISSIINSFFTNTIYFISYENWEIGTQFFQYIFGDLIGALIIFYILKFSKKMLKSFIG